MNKAIIDTGPLVAFINRSDQYHDWSCAQLKKITPPLLSCESVISEASFLLRKSNGANAKILAAIQNGLIQLPFNLNEEASAISKLMDKYKDVPMSLADACLVRLCEQMSDAVVLTLDSEFLIYRKHGRQVIPHILPKNLIS